MLTAICILSLIGNVLPFPSESAPIHTLGGDTHCSPSSLSFICSLKGSVVKEGLARKHHSFSSRVLLSGLTASQERGHSMSLMEAEERLVPCLGHRHLLRQGFSGATGRRQRPEDLGRLQAPPKGKASFLERVCICACVFWGGVRSDKDHREAETILRTPAPF